MNMEGIEGNRILPYCDYEPWHHNINCVNALWPYTVYKIYAAYYIYPAMHLQYGITDIVGFSYFIITLRL